MTASSSNHLDCHARVWNQVTIQPNPTSCSHIPVISHTNCTHSHSSSRPFGSYVPPVSDAAEPPFVLRKPSAAAADEAADPSLPATGQFTLIHYEASSPFKGEDCFLYIKPYNKDIYDHIQCSAALL